MGYPMRYLDPRTVSDSPPASRSWLAAYATKGMILTESEVGGVRPTGKSFRFVRTCVRAAQSLVKSGKKVRRVPFPFSLLWCRSFPFPFGGSTFPFSLPHPH